jgi:hypothetical protein
MLSRFVKKPISQAVEKVPGVVTDETTQVFDTA